MGNATVTSFPTGGSLRRQVPAEWWVAGSFCNTASWDMFLRENVYGSAS